MKYTGRLSKTIAQKRIGVFSGEDVYLAEAKRTTDEMFSKLPDLFKAHQVAEGNWVALALALAKAHVPGFKVVKPAGRRPEWDISHKAEFRLDVDTIIEKSGLKKISVVEAIKLVCRRDDWAAKTKTMELSALEKQYYLADLRWVEVVRGARSYNALPECERHSYESIVSTN